MLVEVGLPARPLALAMGRHGVPEQILTDNGKVFTGRFGPGTGEVLFDRICRVIAEGTPGELKASVGSGTPARMPARSPEGTGRGGA